MDEFKSGVVKTLSIVCPNSQYYILGVWQPQVGVLVFLTQLRR